MSQTISIQQQDFMLHASGAVFWKQQSMLLIADVHLGKVTHFRKYGAAIPVEAAYQNLEKLTEVVNSFQPKTICFLGDLFHSKTNNEWQDFVQWLGYTNSKVILVIGNHDIIPSYKFEEAGVEVVAELIIDTFYLTHHPAERNDYYTICGHIHPGVILEGMAKQKLRLPCFFQSTHQLILPAFGTFTGKHIVTPKLSDVIYVIADNEVLCVT